MVARSREFPKITTLRWGWGQLFRELPAPRGVTPTTLKKFSYQLCSIDFWTYRFGPSVEYFQIFIPASSSYTGYFSNLGWYETGVYYIPGGYMGRYNSRCTVHYTWYEMGVPNDTWLYPPGKVPCYPCWWLIPVLRPGTCFTHIKALLGWETLPDYALPCVCPYSSKALTLELYLSLNIFQN
jgi:hypothetical protein